MSNKLRGEFFEKIIYLKNLHTKLIMEICITNFSSFRGIQFCFSLSLDRKRRNKLMRNDRLEETKKEREEE
jgi:hypothetical protein